MRRLRYISASTQTEPRSRSMSRRADVVGQQL